ncbi:TonB-dependent receptor [Paraglaciecola hydrolytica]|uniref:Ligand-gated channel protein n=1 Tax=Paraglaciecola hydrolytica TaxID=1799789 RepID=A0A136A3G2_9ALTE|nr:TonB-dependent receptor [Paraglaciecola hydrolytica]KXI29670.1 ligand-gated channel protein [Paraglaciecola hydrolytica]
MNNSFKVSLMAAAIVNALALPMVYAQETEKADPNEVEKIEVRGFASTLKQSLFEKRNAPQVVEIISTDDLGALPDVTITDALARLPGISADRDRGNPSRISIRGMGPRLNMATMNGREIVSGEPSRDVRYEQFPAELVSAVQVYKSPMASNVEGGISGLVNLDFVDPLKKDKRVFTVSGNLMHYELADDLPGGQSTGKKFSLSYVDKIGDNFGYALGLAYQDQPSQQRGIESWDYNNGVDRGDIDGNGKPESAPWGGQADTKIGNNERIGAMTILQWAPTDDLTLKYDLFYSKFEIKEREDQYYFTNWGNWQGGQNWDYQNSVSSPNIITKADGTDQLIGGGRAFGSHEMHNATWFQENELISTGLNAVYEGQEWTVKADVGYSQASIDSVWVDIRSNYYGPSYDLTWSVADNDRLAVEILPNVDQGLTFTDIGNPNNYSIDGIETWLETSPGNWEQFFFGMFGDDDRDLTDEMVSAQLDFSRDIDMNDIQSIEFGVRYSDRDKQNRVFDWQKEPIANNGLTDYGLQYDMGGDIIAPMMYTFKDWDLVAEQVFGGLGQADYANQSAGDKLASWQLSETTFNLYAQANLRGTIGGFDYTGNMGVRYVSTESTSSGTQQIANVLSPISVDHDYSEILPSLNIILTLTEDSQLRFGLARTLSRPPLIEMRTGFAINETVEPNTASGGNPTLEPFVANQADVGYEYYFGDDGAITVSLFYKDMKSHIGNAQDNLNFNGVDYEFTGPVNGEGGKIKGFEVLFQQAFTNLPAPFDGLGVYANYSYTDADVKEFVPVNNPYTLAGLSQDVANFTLWYYKEGFEARVSYDYRSEYTSINSWNPSRIALQDAQATVDASISYEFNEHFKVMLQGQNLTDEASTSYWDNDRTRPYDYVEWGRRFLIGFQYSM